MQFVSKMHSSRKLAFFASSVIFLIINVGVYKIEGASIRSFEHDFQSSAFHDLGKFADSILSSDVSLSREEAVEYILHHIVPIYMKDFFDLNLTPEDILEEATFLNVSATCVGHSAEWLYRITNPATVETWVLHMIDAWGKFPEGILSGHLNSVGDFDECIELKARNVDFLSPFNYGKTLDPNFDGKYCAAALIPGKSVAGNFSLNISLPFHRSIEPKTSLSPGELLDLMKITYGVRMYPSIGTCFPSSCSQADVQQILNIIFGSLNEVNQILSFNASVLSCSVEEQPELDSSVWGMIGLLSFIGGLTVLATVIDYFRIKSLEGANKDKPKSNPGTGLRAILAFSLITNIQKWQHTGGGGGDNFGCLHGMRFLSTLWVILAHTWYMTVYVPFWNVVDIKRVQDNWLSLTMLNATISVDTFFVMGGFLVAFNLLKMFEKTGGKLNLPMYYIHRYLRLTPTYAILVGVMATIMPYFGRGPAWGIMWTWAGWCRDNWWTNLLYINNLVHSDQLCQAEAWYLSDDMQFYIFTPFVVYPLWKWNIPGKVILGLLTVLSIIAPGVHMYYHDTVPTVIGTRYMPGFYEDIYIVPWDRAQTYIVGLWLGYILFHTRQKKVTMNKFVVLAGWLISTAIALSVLYGIHPYFDSAKPIPTSVMILYGALHRFGYGLSVSWIIFACIHGYGGYVNKFLSWAPFIPLGRLTFTTYLVSLHLQMTLHLRSRQPISYDGYTMTNYFFAHVVSSLLVGFICTILFESPFIQLEKLLMPGNARPQSPRPKPPAKRNGIFYNTTESIINMIDKDEEKNNSKNAKEQPDV